MALVHSCQIWKQQYSGKHPAPTVPVPGAFTFCLGTAEFLFLSLAGGHFLTPVLGSEASAHPRSAHGQGLGSSHHSIQARLVLVPWPLQRKAPVRLNPEVFLETEGILSRNWDPLEKKALGG